MNPKRASGVADHAAAMLRMFEIEPRPLDRIADAYLRRHRELASGERRAAADAAFGVARWLGRLDGLLLGRGVRKPTWRERVELLLETGGVEDLPREAFPSGDAAYNSFPDFLYRMMCEQYGTDGASEVAAALNRESRPTVRINSQRIDRKGALEMLLREGVDASETKRSPYGIRLGRRAAMGSLTSYSEGFIEVQDEASQLAVVLASPSGGESVLDACAGAGGKSLMMAMLMGGRGRIVAADVDAKKLAELRRRAARAGVENIEAIDAESLDAGHVPGSFDLVFIDAPCTGTGTIRRSPDLKWRLSEAAVEERVREQKKILRRYSKFVKPGGRLVYATCSILREENEFAVDGFLAGGGFQRVDASALLEERGIEAAGLVSEDGNFRADPRLGEWDGFFAAVMIKA